MDSPQLQIAVDVGSTRHRVAVATADGQLLSEFDMQHDAVGFGHFFDCIEAHQRRTGASVVVAMEGYNGWARPLDREVLARGWKLLNVNNLKLARFKEIFPGPAKSDSIDARKILELMQLAGSLRLAKAALQSVAPVAAANDKLKRFTRRRRVLVEERSRVLARLYADLQAVSPGLLEITGKIENRWFLNLLTCREDLRKLASLRSAGMLAIRGVGKVYAAKIRAWQKNARFSSEAEWVSPMIQADARRVLALQQDIEALNELISRESTDSQIATRIDSIPGFGCTCSAELAGEIGTLDRFATEASLALYLGMAVLDEHSGKQQGVRRARNVNVRAKAAMMVAVARHIEQVPASRRYYEKKRAEGKTHNQAVRALGRHLVRVIWSMIRNDRDYQLR